MLLQVFFVATVMAYCFAKVEINIEGKDGWAKNLPTWRHKDWLTDLFFLGYPLTGYHFWQGMFLIFTFHAPFLLGVPFTIPNELLVICTFLYFITLEDFLWFVCNPYYGISKFRKGQIPWHHDWVGPVPTSYVVSLSLFFALMITRSLLL